MARPAQNPCGGAGVQAAPAGTDAPGLPFALRTGRTLRKGLRRIPSRSGVSVCAQAGPVTVSSRGRLSVHLADGLARRMRLR